MTTSGCHIQSFNLCSSSPIIWTTFSIRSGDSSSQMSPTDIRRRPSSVSINCAMPGLQVWALKNGPHFQEQSFYDPTFLQDQRRSAPDLALLPASVELQVESSSSARPSILKVGIAFKRFPIPSRCVQTFVLSLHCFPQSCKRGSENRGSFEYPSLEEDHEEDTALVRDLMKRVIITLDEIWWPLMIIDNVT